MWDEVESDSGNCLGRQCPTYKECFYYRARRRVQNAQILVVNHALFFSDLALRRDGASILPDYDVVIFDEAHNLEAVASDHLGVSISVGPDRIRAQQAVQRADQSRAAGASSAWPKRSRRCSECRYRADEFFDADRRLARPAAWQETRCASASPRSSTTGSARRCSALAASSADVVRSTVPDEERHDFTSAAERLAVLAGGDRRLAHQRQAGHACIGSIRRAAAAAGRGMTLAAAPLDVGPALREQLFDKVPTVIMTSATLGRRARRLVRFLSSRASA